MALSTRCFQARQNVEELLKQAKHRWLTPAELGEMFENHERLPILASQRQERPTSGSIFSVKLQNLRCFRKDGHAWSKKKDNKTIQESHENLKVGGVEKLKCLYAHREDNENFQRRIYQMINEEHGGIALFHYREDEKNRKNCKRGKKTTEGTTQSSQGAGEAIPTFGITGSQGCFTGIVDHGSNQLSLPSQTTDTSNLNNIQGNVESAGFVYGVVNQYTYLLPFPPKTTDTNNQNNSQEYYESAGSSSDTVIAGFSSAIVNHDSYPLPLPPKTTDTCSQNNIQANAQANVEPAGSSSGIVDHDSNQLPLSPKTTDTSNLKNIRGYVESAGTADHDSYRLPLLPKTTNTGNQKNIQANAEPAGSSFGIVNNEKYLLPLPLPPKTTNTSNLKDIQGYDECAGYSSEIVNYESYQLPLPSQITYTSNLKNIQGYAESAGDCRPNYHFGFENQSFPQATENDFPPSPGTPDSLPDLLKSMEQLSEGNKKNLKRGNETPIELLANTFGEEYQDHITFQQNPEWQENRKNCKRSKKLNILEITGSLSAIGHHESYHLPLSDIVDHDNYQLALIDIVDNDNYQSALSSQATYTSNLSNIQGYAGLDYASLPFHQPIESDLSPSPGIPASPCELPELVKHVEPFSESDYASLPFHQAIESDLPPSPGIPASPCELPGLVKHVEPFSGSCIPVVDPTENFGNNMNECLRIRFENLLSPSSIPPKYDDSDDSKIVGLTHKLISLQKKTPKKEISLEQKLFSRLFEKVPEVGSGLTVLDEGGAGVIHLAAALGYDWALETIIVATEIDINFIDKNGWTALDWAVYFGRKHTIEFLRSNGAASGLPSIPTPNEDGNTSVDLAFAAGHPEIGHYFKDEVEHAGATLELLLDE